MHDRRLPAEWEPQSALLITWPHPDTDWCGDLDAAERAYLELAHAVAARQRLLIVCRDDQHGNAIQTKLAASGVRLERISLHAIPYNDTWARDYGPITVLESGRPILLKFKFDGWGGKFEAALDNQVAARLHEEGVFSGHLLETAPLVLEGGSIETDGEGTLLTTTRCLLGAGRNPGLSRGDLERELRARLGLARVLWLESGYLAGDDTDGHIDTLARFCDPNTIVYATTDHQNDPNRNELKQMADELHTLTRADTRPYRLVPLPSPRPMRTASGDPLPATYANFAIINNAVLVPHYRDPADARARAILRGCFPGREIIGIDCRALIRQGGALHCASMQLPAGVTA